MDKRLRASAEEVLQRLMTRRDHLAQQLAVALEPLELTPADLEEQVARCSPALRAQLAAAGAPITEPPLIGVTWEELTRPSLLAMSSRHPGRLVRA
jgi:hypothetical protein